MKSEAFSRVRLVEFGFKARMSRFSHVWVFVSLSSKSESLHFLTREFV